MERRRSANHLPFRAIPLALDFRGSNNSRSGVRGTRCYGRVVSLPGEVHWKAILRRGVQLPSWLGMQCVVIPKVVVIAGPNGAGKSTAAPAVLRNALPTHFAFDVVGATRSDNADIHTSSRHKPSREGGRRPSSTCVRSLEWSLHLVCGCTSRAVTSLRSTQ